MKKVTMYTTPTCVYCKMTRQFFAEHNVKFQEIDVAADAKAAEEMVQKSGQMGVPVITVQDTDEQGNSKGEEQIIIGFDKAGLSRALGTA